MNEFIEWLTGLDWDLVGASIIGFLSVWGGSMIALVVGILKQRTKNFNFTKALEQFKIELNEEQNAKILEFQNKMVNAIEELQKDIIKNNDTHAQERLDALKVLANDVNKTVEEVKEIDINSVIEGIE